MSISSGFYNSLNGDRRYNAEQMSALFDTIINDGVFANVGTAFEVKSTGGMKVSIGIGRAWFNSTWLYNDAPISLTLSASEILLDRYDAVVLEIDHTEAVRAGDIKIVKGTPSSTPQFPTMTSETEVHQYPLAYIYVKAGVTEITQANIMNKIGTSDCPYITGILQVQNIDKIVAQWMAEWEQLTNAKEEEFDNWFATIKAVLDEDIATELLNRVVKLEDGTTPAGDALKLNGLTVEQVGASGARNLLVYPYAETTINRDGVTFTVNADGSITVSGAVASRYGYIYLARNLVLNKGTYTLTLETPDENAKINAWYVCSDGTEVTVSNAYTGSKTFEVSEDGVIFKCWLGYWGTEQTTFTVYPMLEIGSVAHDYVPYHFGGAENTKYAYDADTVDGYHASDFRKVCVVVEDTEADFNNYTEDGVYYFGTSTTLINAPNGAVSGWLDVTHLEGASSLIQRWQERTDETFSSTRTKSSATTWRPWYGFNDDHNIKTYTALEQLGLTNDDISADDFLTAVTTIVGAMPTRSILFLLGSSSTNILTVTNAKINSDLGLSESCSSLMVKFEKYYTNNGLTQINVFKDTTLGRKRIYTCLFDTSSSVVGISKFAESYNADGFLPLTGGPLSGDLYIKKANGTTETKIINYQGNTFLRNYTDDNNYKDLVIRETGLSYINRENGKGSEYNIVHSGNIGSYALLISGGRITRAQNVPLEIANSVENGKYSYIKYLAGGVQLGGLGFNGADNPVYVNSAYNTSHTLLHKGNSNAVIFTEDSTTAPSDTTALWAHLD